MSLIGILWNKKLSSASDVTGLAALDPETLCSVSHTQKPGWDSEIDAGGAEQVKIWWAAINYSCLGKLGRRAHLTAAAKGGKKWGRRKTVKAEAKTSHRLAALMNLQFSSADTDEIHMKLCTWCLSFCNVSIWVVSVYNPVQKFPHQPQLNWIHLYRACEMVFACGSNNMNFSLSLAPPAKIHFAENSPEFESNCHFERSRAESRDRELHYL